MELKYSSQFDTDSTSYQTFDPNNPLFSCIVALSILFLLYLPTHLLYIISSPVFVSTGVLLVYLIRLGLIQDAQKKSYSIIADHELVDHKYNSTNSFDENSFVEWNVKAPLEIIYEDDEEDDDENRIERYTSLSLYYPESDSDVSSSSDDDFAMEMKWESAESGAETTYNNNNNKWDEIGEELIEIALDDEKRRSQFFNDEEDSLIEIDISPTRINQFSGK